MNSRFGALVAQPVALVLISIAPMLLPSLRPLLLVAMSIALCAIGLLILLRAGQVSFGHALYFAIGAYVVAFGSRAGGLDLWVLLGLALVCSVAAGALLGTILVRYRGIFYGMLNLAFSMLGYTVFLRAYSYTGGSDGIRVVPPPMLGFSLDAYEFGWGLYYCAVALLALVFWMVHRYLHSPLGAALGAVKTNEVRLEYLGISAYRVMFVAHVSAAGLAGLGGGLVALSTGHVTPDLAYWSLSAEFVFVAVLGGTANVVGALIGAVSFELIRSYASIYAGNAWQLILGTVLVFVVLFAPQGLWGVVQRVLPARAKEERL
ncbi:branched-chain amino acid ABC transporter permease [Parapusillimonas granuli]|uniref:Branched-chain amino acid ABC transporter permease n=1 Tax=Parapusillimonas granuli TaxID=380911 RepID=A0A853G3K8_9BURK|nr:branched-chain amino acid ABC transporter permease [Parapusillimonas granuli]MBB5214496.1 branched-chain amino acid transport system permease protein [Parapusillimonas granuli]NYT49096.1 branched-chain amino acid ABC transporter permease [Parapusillimonas granuli]